MPASVKAFSKMRRWLSVSTVPPDLDDTTIAVRVRSPASASATWPASVVSSTTSGTPAVAVITSGASDEPPMPASTIRSTPSPASSARSASISPTSGRELSCSVVQDSRMDASGWASGPHSVGSCAASLDAILSAISWSTSGRACSASPSWTMSTEIPTVVSALRLVQLGLHGLEQLGPGLDELVDALGLQHVVDVVDVDAGLLQRVERLLRLLLGVAHRVAPQVRVVRDRVQGLLRH